ncbi:MAG: M15 family metallopeptidase [Peptococcaceae bacterium]|nr:M15 family metallopeptidase [Peptococcaceae bacterium]
MRKRFLILFVLFFTIGCSSVPSTGAANPPAENLRQNSNTEDNLMPNQGKEAEDAIAYHDTSSVRVLVNKQNELPSSYVPPDLAEVNIPFTFSEKAEKRMLRQEAALKLAELFEAAKKESIILYGVSGYRSYKTQKDLFAIFTSRYGSEEKANQISARPGQSEHQTGLAMDVTCRSVNFGLEESFGDTKEYAWLKENAHRYGFIIRYPKGKELITEYTYEPWHLRYVGPELATKLYEKKVTYEEYLFFKV